MVAQVSNDTIHTFTDETFNDDVLLSRTPVLVDFFADWCSPCRAIAPTIDELAAEYAGRVKVGKLNTDDSPETTARYDVRTIPSLIVFKHGEVVERITGLASKAALSAALDKALA